MEMRGESYDERILYIVAVKESARNTHKVSVV
jgi:hypothetical protein